MYAYLVGARQELWPFLESLTEGSFTREMIPGDGVVLRSIQDLALHVPVVEDGWLHEDLGAGEAVWKRHPHLLPTLEAGRYDAPLSSTLAYWRDVQEGTLTYLAGLSPEDLRRAVPQDTPYGRRDFTVEGILRHVMLHEVRHVSQITLLARQQGIKPPFLDYLRWAESTAAPDA